MRTNPSTRISLSILASCALLVPAFGEGWAGKMTENDFNKKNQEAAEKVGKIKVDDKAISDADAALLRKILAGGTMQLEVNKIAYENAGNSEVKTIAKGEIDEQTALAAKIKEINDKKKLGLSMEPDAETVAAVKELSALKGDEAEAMFLKKIGVEGHEKLNMVMTEVKDNVKDAAIKEIAEDALPLIAVHLQVAKDQAAKTGNPAAKE